uniref:MFS transporter n=1 Tax=Cyberlindnera americana TaxID=36016 RepID=A0A5P8N8L1_9ASCO|nr:MFS transporter [Cyberlindnera americana]
MSGLFEKSSTDQVSSANSFNEKVEVHIDRTTDKISKIQDDPNFNFDHELEELEILASEYRQNRTWFQRMLALEIEMNFENKNHMVMLLGTFAAAAGLLSGLDQSIISGASIGMKPALNLTTNEASLVSSLMPLGAMAGSIMMTPLNEYFGRKMSIIISCIWYTIGASICAGSVSHQMMYAGRFLLGIGVGIEGGCVGIYISESVPANVRGNIVSMYQFNIALGEVLGYAVAAMFYDVHGGWRYMVGSSLVFSIALFIGMFFLPESPRYLVHKNRIGEAYAVWKRLRDMNDKGNQLEFFEMRQAAFQEHERAKEESRFQSAMELFLIPRNRRALIYGSLMIFFGQMSGINGVLYYLSTLMEKIGFSTKHSVFMSLVGGGSLLLGTIPAILYMDRFGRRTWGMNIIGCIVGLVFVGAGYQINTSTNLPAAEGVYLTGIILYMGFFGSYACLTWVVPAESFDMKTRPLGMTICSTFLYLWSFIVTYNFTKMQNAFTYTGLTLGFYGGIAVLGLVYQFLFMPETKDKTLEEIDDIFSRSSFDIARENIANAKKWFSRS